MRLDQLLHRLCLFKTRSQAARACAEGRVMVNGTRARPAREIRPGDCVVMSDEADRWQTEVEILAIPAVSVSRKQARDFYRLIARKRCDELWM